MLVALPFAAVTVIGFAVLVVGAPRPYAAARIHGGPVLGVKQVSLRVAGILREGEVELPLAGERVRVELNAGRQARAWEGALDDQGFAFPHFELEQPAASDVELSVRRLSGGQALAQGRVALSSQRWSERAQRRGGFVPGKQTGELRVRVAPGAGAFAVPFSTPLWIEVFDGTSPVEGARLELSPQGLQLPKTSAVTDARGRAALAVVPLEHVVSVRVNAQVGPRSGTWAGALPIVPGAMLASREQGRLTVRAPIARARAYWSVQTASARLLGGAVELAPDSRGGAVGSVDLPELPREPVWCVVSSEPDLASPATLGWPCTAAQGEQPPQTFAVADERLVDGALAAFGRETERRHRARLLALLFGLGAALLTVLLMLKQSRDSRLRLSAHLREAGADAEVEQRLSDRGRFPWRAAIAVVCVLLGFAVTALIAMFRLD
jgi:hypothetical protein